MSAEENPDLILEGRLDEIPIVNQGYIAGNLGPKDELLPGNDNKPRRFRRKIIRRIEVPYIRKVKVPVVTKEIVPCEIEKRIVIKKAVEVIDYEEVEEEYTDYVDKSGTRDKEIWKESVEMKEEIRERQVARTRKVKRPITRIIEEPDEQIIKVQSTKIEEVQAWRLDEVTEMKEVEDISYEVFDLIAHPDEEAETEIISSREIGVVDSQHSNRTQGTRVFLSEHIERGDVDLNGIPADESMDNRQQEQQAFYSSNSYSSAHRIGADGQLLLGDGGASQQQAITYSQGGSSGGSSRRAGRRSGRRGDDEPASY